MEVKKYQVAIEQSSDVEDLCGAWDMLGKILCFHPRHKFGHDEGFTKESFDVYMKDNPEDFYFPLYTYDHSGVTISLTPFNGRWDSMQIGYVWVKRDEAEKEFWTNFTVTIDGNTVELMKATPEWNNHLPTKVLECIQNDVKSVDMWLTGDVWDFIVTDENGDVVESGNDIYGRDYAEQEGKETLNRLEAEAIRKQIPLTKKLTARASKPSIVCKCGLDWAKGDMKWHAATVQMLCPVCFACAKE